MQIMYKLNVPDLEHRREEERTNKGKLSHMLKMKPAVKCFQVKVLIAEKVKTGNVDLIEVLELNCFSHGSAPQTNVGSLNCENWFN